MPRRHWTEGQEVKYEDLNAITYALERQFYDRIIRQMVDTDTDGFWNDSFLVTRTDSDTVSVAAGVGIQIDNTQTSPQSVGRPIVSTAAQSLDITTPDATNDRIDIVVVKSDLADELSENRRFKDVDDGTISTVSTVIQRDWTNAVQIVAGTPAGSPSAPSVPAGYIKIAELYVTASTGMATDAVTDSRTQLSIAVADGYISTAKLADGAVTQAKVASGVIENSHQLVNIGISTSVASNALTIALKQADGSTDPTSTSAAKIAFRSSTIVTGAIITRGVTGALSITVPSGATLRHRSGATEYIYLYAIDNSGTVELAVSSALWDERELQSTTAIDTSSDSIALYSTTARSNVPIRLLGRITSTQTTAGTWAASMDAVALASLNAFSEKTITAKYQRGSSQTIDDATYTTIDYSTKVWDSHNAVNTGTWTFTAPRPRKYQVTATMLTASTTWTAGQQVQLVLAKNNVVDSYMGVTIADAGVTSFLPCQGTAIVPLDTDDYIDVRFYQNSGGALGTNTTGAFNYIEIVECGDYS